MATKPNEKETPFEKFKEFTRKVVSVPKAEIDRREREYQESRKKKRIGSNNIVRGQKT